MLPILFQSSDLILYSYPLMMGLGWGVAYQIFFSLLPPGTSQVRSQFLFWGVFLFSWIGAKILFILTLPSHLSDPLMAQASFWTGGGFVFYGGLLGAITYLFIYKNVFKSLNSSILWAILPAVAFGHGIGRIGCFLAGCCYGERTDLFWGIFLHGDYRHPTQLIEATSLLLMGAYLYKSKRPKMILVGHYLGIYGALRLVVESLRGDLIRGTWGSLTPSQWISIALIISSLLVLINIKRPWLRARPQKF